VNFEQLLQELRTTMTAFDEATRAQVDAQNAVVAAARAVADWQAPANNVPNPLRARAAAR